MGKKILFSQIQRKMSSLAAQEFKSKYPDITADEAGVLTRLKSSGQIRTFNQAEKALLKIRRIKELSQRSQILDKYSI